jgi:hypothetical protein
VPDHAHAVLRLLDAERAGLPSRAQLSRCAGFVDRVAVEDLDGVDRLTFAQRDVAIRAAERAVERKRQALVDDDRPVGLDLDEDPGFGEGEALTASRRRRDERDYRDRQS